MAKVGNEAELIRALFHERMNHYRDTLGGDMDITASSPQDAISPDARVWLMAYFKCCETLDGIYQELERE